MFSGARFVSEHFIEDFYRTFLSPKMHRIFLSNIFKIFDAKNSVKMRVRGKYSMTKIFDKNIRWHSRRQKYSIKIFDDKNWMTKWHANAEYTTTKYSITKYSVTKIFDDKNIRWQNMLHLLAISGPSMPVLGHGCLFFASSAVAFGFLWPLPILGLACRFFDHQNKNIKLFSKSSLRKISANSFCNSPIRVAG